MNNPPYVVVDEVGAMVAAVKAKLSLPNLNYLYGYLSEINETLIQDSETAAYRVKKYPLVWLVQPFTIDSREVGYYGNVSTLRIIIINGSDINWKAEQRMTNNFKPILYPIYNGILNELKGSKVFLTPGPVNSSYTDRYYWGEEQQRAINDVFDCMDVTINDLKIKNNLNCP